MLEALSRLPQKSPTPPHPPIDRKVYPCAELNDKIERVSEDPIKIEMADGEHYILTEIALCIDQQKISNKEFSHHKTKIIQITEDTLAKVSKNDLFKSQNSTHDSQFTYSLHNRRERLLINLSSEFPWIKEVYFESFLIQ